MATTLAYEPWPTWDEEALKETSIVIPVQVNGKLRSRLELPADSDAEAVEAAALADPKIVAFIDGKTIVKKIVIPGRTVNIVVKD